VHASDACERKLTVGLGEAGMRYLGREGALPAGVQVPGL